MKKRILQHKLFASFKQFKEKFAIREGDQKITYRELDQRSDHIAHWLIDRGIGKETFIGVLLEDRIELISTMLGILKAGCVFMPLDPAFPGPRLESMINSTHTAWIIGNSQDRGKIDTAAPIEYTTMESILSGQVMANGPVNPGETPGITYNPEDKIYVYFTSGTTGTPKAFVGKNKSLHHFIDWEIETFRIGENYQVSQFTNPGFDAFLRDVFVPLCCGGTICIPGSKEILLDSRQCIDWVEQSGINLIHCTPSLFRVLNSDILTPHHFHNLKFVLLSGEKIEPTNLETWYMTFADRIQLVNLWGTSETTLAKTYYLIDSSDVYKERIPVGKPISGARVIVLDNDMNICDDNITGEIYIRTPFRTCGYYNDPGLNQQQFIRNPFNDDPDDLLHKTGDSGRFLPDGNLDVLGRIDRQLKIRGIRVEPEEIESIMVTHPAVNEAVVIKREITNKNKTKNESLLAFVTTNQTSLTDEEFAGDLKAYLSEKLPAYMIPSQVIHRAIIPRTPNGKIDYKVLAGEIENEKSSYIPPSNDIEKKLVQLWWEILGIKRIGITDHFFDLGGNSLNIMTLITKIHKEFDVRIPLGETFDNPTIEKQAKIIRKSTPNRFFSIPSTEKKEYYIMSSAQKRLYILQQMDPGNLSYNISEFHQFSGDIDRERFEGAIAQLVLRHESFRTSFMIIRGEPMQKVHDTMDFKMLSRDISGIETRERPGVIEKMIEEFILPFDLTHAPFLRVGLIKIEKQKYIFMLDIHHIITDGVSQRILLQEFSTLYQGAKLSPLKLQYKDYAQWQEREKNQEELKQQEAYWLKKCSPGLPVLNIPTDYPRPALQSFAGNSIAFDIGRETTAALQKLAKQEDVTMYILILSLFNLLFSRITGQEEIVLGADTAGRNHLDLAQVIGMFVNTVVLVNSPGKDKTFSQFLQDVKEQTLEAWQNQDYQFDRLVEKLGIKKDASRNPLFDIMYSNPEFTAPPDREPPGETDLMAVFSMEPYHQHISTSKFDMNIKVQQKGNFIIIEYNTSLYKQSTIERYMGYFKEIAAQVLEKKEIQLQDIIITHELVEVKSIITLTQLEF